jgi:hypothetical protein
MNLSARELKVCGCNEIHKDENDPTGYRQVSMYFANGAYIVSESPSDVWEAPSGHYPLSAGRAEIKRRLNRKPSEYI